MESEAIRVIVHHPQRRLGDRVINAVGHTTPRQAGALLERCQLFVGNDAGPMHLAAAAGVPVVETSCHPRSGSALHANSPRRSGVPGEPCSEACVAPEAHCILEVSLERAKEAVCGLASRRFASALFKRGLLDAS